jgi:hypothetical protein
MTTHQVTINKQLTANGKPAGWSSQDRRTVGSQQRKLLPGSPGPAWRLPSLCSLVGHAASTAPPPPRPEPETWAPEGFSVKTQGSEYSCKDFLFLITRYQFANRVMISVTFQEIMFNIVY